MKEKFVRLKVEFLKPMQNKDHSNEMEQHLINNKNKIELSRFISEKYLKSRGQ